VAFVLNQDRGQSVNAVQNVSNVVPTVLVILWVGTYVLDRTRFGRYLYAIGRNAEGGRPLRRQGAVDQVVGADAEESCTPRSARS